MIRKKVLTAILAIALCMGMAAPAYAVYDPMKAMMEASRRAVAAAIKAGTIPADATIYDCAYSTDANGVSIVVQYRDKDGNWIDVVTGKPAAVPKSTAPAKSDGKLTEEQLAEYAEEVFQLVNEAREEEGLPALERDDTLDAAANVRAGEYASIKSIRVNGKAHTRLDGSKFTTVLDEMDIDWSGGASENSSARRNTPEEVMTAWLASDGHRANILRENRTHIGIGIRQDAGGRLYWIQLFTTPA
jgi:uncharacterized protein YkwD